jgi:hypothetical protein
VPSASSPRPWGCFPGFIRAAKTRVVFPTPVGVFPRSRPHLLPYSRSSPRPWGCFPGAGCRPRYKSVFPTPVGVFLKRSAMPGGCGSLPHARGGVSYSGGRLMALNLSSPRPWGCFCVGTDYEVTRVVFPTPVGVFPPWPRPDSPESSLPHARGGVSGIVRVAQLPVESSPRPWGCFSAIASGAVSKVGLPHARGGVSDPRYPVWSLGLSSPRPWGCFRLDANWAAGDGVFPTPVGVFPIREVV